MNSSLPLPRHARLLAGVFGGGAALGQAPFDLWPLTFFAFAAVLWLAHRAASAGRLALLLWIAGFGYFGVALHWIVEPFFVDAARHAWMAPFALVFMAGGMALFWAVAGWAAGRLAPPGRARLWMLAGVLVLLEAVRATVLTGFPWAHPGHVLIASEWLAASAWGGPHALTALILFTSTSAVHLAGSRRPLLGVLPIVTAIGLGFVPLAPSAPPAGETAPVVRLIQPNAPQHLKWLPEMIPVFFDRGLALTSGAVDPALGPPDLVIWPETSLPDLLGRSDVARAELSQAAGTAAILIGAQRYEGIRPRNASALLDRAGRITDIYDKHRLVPFGEYMPLGDVLADLGIFGLAAAPGGYQPGPGPALLELPGDLGRTFPMICYEAIFPAYIRDVPRPDWIAHLTNDAWFGSFSGPYQHLALARLRAAEQGLPVLRAANTGISAAIDARGRIVAQTQLDEAAFLDIRLPGTLPSTVYARLGDWPVLIGVLLVTGLAGLRARRGGGLRTGV